MSGDIVTCEAAGQKKTGIYITHRDDKVVIKLESGYNIGVGPGSCIYIERPPPVQIVKPQVTRDRNLPDLSIVSTGGTIASRIDYRTGSVTSQFDAGEIVSAIPELGGVANYRTRSVSTILSENMTPAIWQELASAVFEEIRSGAFGVIITHGTDTMAYSASALSFMIRTPVPVVFVGSQRSADRPSGDNAMNAVCAASAATSDLGEVAVVMHATTNDDYCSIHRGTRVRKMHTSRRDAFQSIGIPPLGTVSYPSRMVTLEAHAVRRGTCSLELKKDLEERCGLVQFYPGMAPENLAAFDGYKGLVISGTGLGHISTGLVPYIRDLNGAGTMVVMTSQCMHGRVCDRVYDTGRDLLDAGVIEGGDMLPEVALVKLMWVLGNEKDMEKAALMMQSDLAGEWNRRSLHGL